MVDGVEDEFNSGRDAELVEDPEQILLDRMFTEPEFHGNLPIGEALGNQSDDLFFARSKKMIPVRVEYL